MSDPTPPPPGWYADPAGAHGSRWWDGAAWTSHVREAQPADDPPPVPAAPDTGGLPLTSSGRQRRIALAVAVLLVGALAATAAIGLRSPGRYGQTRPDGRPLGEVLPDATVPPPMDPADVAARAEDAGCRVVVDGDPVADTSHLDPADAPPPEALYEERPAHSGRHYGTILPIPAETAGVPLDERAVLHNMEHGSVVVWFDPDALGDTGVREVADWRDERADLGFTSRAGGAIFASPLPTLDPPRPGVALRAWGVAVDCDRFDPVVADAFLVEHWGSHGDAPEASLSPYPEGSLRLRERA